MRRSTWLCRRFGAPALLALLVGFQVGATGDQWPQWRGPTRDGQWTGPTWPERLTPAEPGATAALRLAWRAGDLGPSYTGPIVSDDFIYTVQTRDKRAEVVTCFDRSTGERVWSTEWEGAMAVPFFAARNGSWVRSTPALDGDRLYVGGMRDVLCCLDARTGVILWRADFMERYRTPLPAFGFVSSPLVDGDAVYVQAGASVVKLNKMTGETIWRSLVDEGGMNGSAFASPIMAELCGVRQLVVQNRTQLAGIDPRSGDVLWSAEIRAFRGMNILTPIVDGDTIFTATYGGRAQLLRIVKGEKVWAVERVWDNGAQGYMTSPVLIAGHVYYFTRSNRFTCLELATGTIKWTSGPTGDEYWSLIAQGDRILALSQDGDLSLIRANPEKFEIIDRTELTNAETWAHLAVAGRQVIVREQEGLSVYSWE